MELSTEFLSPPSLSPRRKHAVPSPARRKINVRVGSSGEGANNNYNGKDYEGKLVDEDMIVLRLRIREVKIQEAKSNPPANWMEWEKQYFAYYDSDVCQAIGLLQNFFINTRPCLGLGMVVLVTLSLVMTTGMTLFHAVEMAKWVLLGLHIGT